MQIIKRNGILEEYDFGKIEAAIKKAYDSQNTEYPDLQELKDKMYSLHNTSFNVETIQNIVEDWLMQNNRNVARAYILYRAQHTELRFIKDRSDYIEKYSNSNENAATMSEIDSNANVQNKNVATLEAELYKTTNTRLSRYRVTKKLKEMGVEHSEQYIKDLNSHIIYKHDESSAPAIKPYCVAVNLYPFLQKGTSSLDKLHTTAPKNMSSFCGQFGNLVFLLSSQFQGAVAFGEFFNVFTYYCIKEYGPNFMERTFIQVLDAGYKKKTIGDLIDQAFQGIIYTINQPAGNRSYQSPFTNVSYFDRNYWEAMFKDFVFPDGTKIDYDQVNFIQKRFMRWFNAERKKTLLTFPVETIAMLTDGKDIIDKEWKDFTAEMYAEGHSFFTYISDNADSLSSCCFTPETKILWKSSTMGVQLTSLKELDDLKWEPYKKNLKIFHNGFWIKGKTIKTSNVDFYRVETANHKVYYMTDNHINVTLNGEKKAKDLTTNDYLMFNTSSLSKITENDEHLTYAQGFIVGAFLGNGSFGSRYKDGTIYDSNYSQNVTNYKECMKNLDISNHLLGNERNSVLSTVYNNVYPIRISSKELVAFIQKWTNWKEGTYSYNKELNLNCLLQSEDFRKGILAGWYSTDGGNSNRCYTTSEKLKDCMEALITSLGLNSIIDYSDRTDEPIYIRGEEYNRNYPLWCIRWYEPCNKANMLGVYKWRNNSQFFKIVSITHPGKVPGEPYSYCIECNNKDNPYFTLPSGLITHNCRLRNAVKPEFSFTSGNVGVATGSKSVITLNINRIVQDYFIDFAPSDETGSIESKWKYSREWYKENQEEFKKHFTEHLINILHRVYLYHTAYNELLKDLVHNNMMPVYNEGYINLKQQFLTIGINGINEAAEFLGITCSDNIQYENFCKLITSVISEQNKRNTTSDTRFNTEFVPAESLGIKNYNWDKEDGYWVPKDRNCYTSYFFKPDDDSINVLEQFRMQGKRFTGTLDGGVALHCNLEDHLSKEQYLKLIDYAIHEGTSYFTFNIPNSQCDNCGFITKHSIEICPNCGSKNITLWTRIIGYLRPIKGFSKGRRIESNKRIYNKSLTKD